jgi:hypothetical protein
MRTNLQGGSVMSDNFEMYGAQEGWEHPDVGDLVEIASQDQPSGLKWV